MGSSRKEGEKDREKRESRKRKHKSRSRSRERESSKAKLAAVKQEQDPEREREKRKDKERHKKSKQDREYPEERDVHHGKVKRETESSQRESSPGGASEEPPIAATSEASLSIEETNKLRAKLGLRPLDLDTETSKQDTNEDEATTSTKKADVHIPAENLAEKKATENLRRKLEERREKRKIESRLAGIRALGDDDECDDALSWVERSRQIQKEKEEAEKRAKMLEQLDEEFGVGELVNTEYLKDKAAAYNAKHLKGLRVEHDEENFAEGREVILTLKDQDVLAADEDVLVNVNLKDDERYKKNVEAKKQKPGYQPYENDEFDEHGVPKERTLLAKYDVEIDGEKKKSFVLGEADNSEQRKAKTAELIRAKLNQEQKRVESLDSRPLQLASEYYTPQEMVSFKKVKKKVRKVRGKSSQPLKADDLLKGVDEEETLADLGSRNEQKKRQRDILQQVDDLPAPDEDLSQVKLETDDMQPFVEEALGKAKKLRQKRRENIVDLEQLALSIKREPEDADMEDTNGVKSSIVLNATAEFCRALGDIPTYGMAGNRDEDQDEIMDFERQLAEERRRTMAKEERRREVERRQERGGWNTVENDRNEDSDEDMETDEPKAGVSGTVILDEEPNVGTGMAAALKLAVNKGYIEKEEKRKAGTISKSATQLQAVNYTIEDKLAWEEDKYSRRSRHDGPTVEFREKEGYKPDVKLDYVDDTGKVMTTKEAFRFLSHKFHGKGSGKQKTEKRSLKSQEKKLMDRMSSTDTPLHTLSKLQEKQKELQSPYVVLSGKHASTSIVKPGKGKK